MIIDLFLVKLRDYGLRLLILALLHILLLRDFLHGRSYSSTDVWVTCGLLLHIVAGLRLSEVAAQNVHVTQVHLTKEVCIRALKDVFHPDGATSSRFSRLCHWNILPLLAVHIKINDWILRLAYSHLFKPL